MLVFSGITKYFGEKRVALEDIDLEIESGEFVFLTGHSGSGKTTLLKLLIQEYLPTSGTIIFEETEVNRLRGNKVARHRQQIGVVFQDCRLLPEMTVWENIALPLQIVGLSKNEINERVTDLLELVDLVDFDNLFPIELSGGQAQRVAIARALATSPKLIFADEPTGNLDHEASELIVSLLEKINDHGTTVIFSTHNLSLADKVSKARKLTLEKGKLVKDSRKKKTAVKVEELEEKIEKKKEEKEVEDESI